MTQFTPEFILAARELAAKATARPWTVDKWRSEVNAIVTATDWICQFFNKCEDDFSNKNSNAAFIVTACNNYEAALSEIERLQREVERLKQLVGTWNRTAELLQSRLDGAKDGCTYLDKNGEHCFICEGDKTDDSIDHDISCPFYGLPEVKE